jgi:hypothetical protein
MQKQNFPEKLLGVLGDIKVFKWPMFINYRPYSFAIKGNHTREVMALVQPGDILVRDFNNYLNNYFTPGTFKHVGFYLGDVSEHRLKLAEVKHPAHFNTGKQRVIHAIGNQVFLEDLIDFCRCDGLAIMRFPRQLKLLKNATISEELQAYFNNPAETTGLESSVEEKPQGSKGVLKRLFSFRKGAKDEPVDEDEDEPEEKVPEKQAKPDATFAALVKAEKDIAQYLAQGKAIAFDKIFKILYRVAIRELNIPYDHDLGMERFYATRCTEFVYFITKSLCWNYGIEPELNKVFFKKRLVITPDAFVDSQLEEVWKSDI